MGRHRRTARLLATVAALGCLALATAGCKTLGSTDTTGSIAAPTAPRAEADWRREAEAQGARYRADPRASAGRHAHVCHHRASLSLRVTFY